MMGSSCLKCLYLMKTPGNRLQVEDVFSQINWCSRCRFLHDSIIPYFSRDDLRDAETTISLYLPEGMPLDINIYTSENPYIPHVVLHVFKSNNDIIDELAGIATGNSVAKFAGDTSCITFVKDQLSKCAQHQECEAQLPKPSPKRLVAIHPQQNKVWLVTTEGDVGRYVALSYCWGVVEGVLKTTTRLLKPHHANIPWHELPKTIQDAVVVSRQIGLHYIWIDSLCIIQDDQADWRTEAAKMADYYSNALLTMGASSAASAQDGIMVQRDPWYPPTKVSYSGSDGKNHELLVQRRPYLPTFDAAEMGPIGTRGWTVQENALSKRMVHFTRIGLFWECEAGIVSENGHPVLQNAGDVSLIRQFLQEFEMDFAVSWHTFVEMYTLRKLTFTKDKLPAIAGIASQLHTRFGSNYRAGLWEENVGSDLTWMIASNASHSTFTSGAPSWSWTSIESPVQYPEGLWAIDRVLCYIEKNPKSRSHEASFLDAGEHKLVVNGPIDEILLTFEAPKATDGTDSTPNYKLSISKSVKKEYDKFSLTFWPDTRLEVTSVTDKDGYSFQTVRRCTQLASSFQATVFCLWCVQQPPDSDIDGFENELVGIVLGQVEVDTYCRLGVVSMLGFPDRTERLDMLRKSVTLV